MRTLVTRLLAIGSDPRDDEDTRVRKVLLLTAVLMVLPAGLLWGSVYWWFGQTLAALSPWTYVVVGLGSIVFLAATGRYVPFAAFQFACFLVLPFTLMWSLGGFVSGSAVALWAWLSPLGARSVGHRRSALLLLIAFVCGFVLSALLQPGLAQADPLPDEVVIAFFVLNVVAVATISFVLIDAASGGREGTLAAMRGLVYRYLSPDVADSILAHPERQELGGELVEVTILFADLGGYTAYASDRSPHEVVELLNRSFATALPAIQAEGGTPVQLPGDAVMAIFGAPRRSPDHARQAAGAALAIQRAGDALAVEQPAWPRFRIGINTGEALVGNIGTHEFRNFTAIGDTVNMAQRFGTLARPGQVIAAPATALALGENADIEWLDEVAVKGKPDPVRPGLLVSLHEP